MTPNAVIRAQNENAIPDRHAADRARARIRRRENSRHPGRNAWSGIRRSDSVILMARLNENVERLGSPVVGVA